MCCKNGHNIAWFITINDNQLGNWYIVIGMYNFNVIGAIG